MAFIKTAISASTWLNLDYVTKIDISEVDPGDWAIRAHHQSPSTTASILFIAHLTTEQDALDALDKLLSSVGVLEA